MTTDKAGTTKKDQVTANIPAGLQAEKIVHHPGKTDVPTTQADTTHTASMDHHTTQIDIEDTAPHR